MQREGAHLDFVTKRRSLPILESGLAQSLLAFQLESRGRALVIVLATI